MRPRDFERALAQAAEEGLLPRENVARLATRLPELLAPAPGDSASRIARIVAALGGLALAAGILFLIGLHWEDLGRGFKLFLIFGTLTGLHVSAWRLAEGDGSVLRGGRHPAVGIALAAAGLVSFGGAIGLVAQIYHLESHWPNAWLAWWALSLPFVLLYRSRPLASIAFALFTIWSYRCVDVWVEDHALWRNEAAWIFATFGVAAVAAAVATLCRGTRFEGFAPLLGGCARMGGLAGLFLLSFEDLGHVDRNTDLSPLDPARIARLQLLLAPTLVLLASATLVAGVALAQRFRRTRDVCLGEALDAGAVLAAALSMIALEVLAPAAAFVPANALIGVAALLLITRGVRTGRAADVNLAVAAFVVTLFARYFEWFTEGLGPAFTFVGAGILLLATGYYIERLRRRWIADAKRSLP